ncbi:MAG: hypothetical protein GX994_06320 [Firmicutes bacterium]|nr:hypothetical protein [Bacillota bacterium]
MRKKLTRYLAAAILLLVGFTSLTASTQKQIHQSSISGSITACESNLPLVKGTITIGNETVEIKNGYFIIENVPVGKQKLIIDCPFRKKVDTTINIKPGNNNLDVSVDTVFNQEEIDILAKITRAEAEGEAKTGKIAVAATILNRVHSNNYPATIKAVVYQCINGKYQYSPVRDGRINLSPRTEDYQAAYQALAGSDPSLGATGFFNAAKTKDQWVRAHPVTVRIGQHTFFSY